MEQATFLRFTNKLRYIAIVLILELSSVSLLFCAQYRPNLLDIIDTGQSIKLTQSLVIKIAADGGDVIQDSLSTIIN